MGDVEMKVSVIIAHDPARGMEALGHLQYEIQEQLQEYEIWIMEDGSKSAARNKAAKKSKSEILVFLDDDVRLRDHFFDEILAPFEDPTVGIVGGVNVAPKDISGSEKISAVLMSSPFCWLRSVARYTPRGEIRESDEAEIIGCCMAVRKKAFDKAGGFPLDVIPCEENVLINRIKALGWRVLYHPYAVVYHRRSAFPFGYASKVFDYGTGRGIMMRRGGSRGFPKSIWKPSWRWILYFLGFWIHHGSYILGVFNGFFIKKKYQEKDDD
jgi:GT2 family glycosyltransferase